MRAPSSLAEALTLRAPISGYLIGAFVWITYCAQLEDRVLVSCHLGGMMYPFPATIDGKSVMVYDIHQTDTGAVCAIVHPNGLTGFAQWSRLIVTPPLPTVERTQPVVDLTTLCRILDASGPDDLIAAARDVMDELHNLHAKVRGRS